MAPPHRYNLPKAAVRLAARVFPDHHSQGALLAVMVIVAVVFFKSLEMVAATVVFFVAHFHRGGAGTFQRPLRSDARPAAADILLVALGVGALVVYVCLGLFYIVGRATVFVRWLGA